MCQLPNVLGIPIGLYLILKLLVYSLMWRRSYISCVFQKRNWKIVGVVNHILDWRGSQFYDFNEHTFSTQFLWVYYRNNMISNVKTGRKNSEKNSVSQMGIEPTTLRDLIGFSNHWATGDYGEQESICGSFCGKH